MPPHPARRRGLLHGVTSLDELSTDPHSVWERLRQDGPIAWVESLGGWVTLTRSLAVDVMRDADTFTVDDPRFTTGLVVGPSMLSLDGAEHARHRAGFVDGMRPVQIESDHGEWMDTAAASLVERLLPGGRAELRTELAGPWSVLVMARVLGLSLDEAAIAQMLDWYRAIVGGVEAASAGQPLPTEALAAARELGEAVGIAPFVRADGLTDAEIGSNTAVFLFGGIETTEATIANALFHLLSDVALVDAVRADPSLLAAAVDESQRLEPAATRVDRYATRDIEISGAKVRKGDLVIVSLAAANRDPAGFPDPHRFDLHRSNARSHVTFATGPHACIAMYLARRETITPLRVLFDRMPNLRLDSTHTDPPTGLIFRKPARVSVTW
jgi:cytochrome P450